MGIIETYSNVKHKLEIKQEYLENLLEQKALLHSKYNKLTSSMSEAPTNGSSISDKMTNYMIELTKVNEETGMSLNDEINVIQKEVEQLEVHLNKMTINLLKLHGIEYELYSQIAVKGLKLSKAVSMTSNIYDVTERTVWRVYNKKIKKFIKCQ